MQNSTNDTMPPPRPISQRAARYEAIKMEAKPVEAIPAVGEPLPAEAEFILTALEAASAPAQRAWANRRQFNRMPYRAIVHLRLFSDSPGAQPWVLYARDVSIKSLGFVSRDRLPLGYGGMILLRTPDGKELQADCVLQRCRETVSGWFEGSLAFNRTQRAFEKE